MDNYWAGQFVQLRLVKTSDKEMFFIKDGTYRMMLKGHLEQDPFNTMSVDYFEKYFAERLGYSFYHDFIMIICDVRSDYPLGILEIYDTNTRNGVFFLGFHIDKEYENDNYYLEAIKIITDFLYNQLRYHVGFITVSSNQTSLINLLRKEGFELSGVIKKRYHQFYDQLIFRIKNEG